MKRNLRLEPSTTPTLWRTFKDNENINVKGTRVDNNYTPLRVVSWNILGDGPSLSMSQKHDYCPKELRLWKGGDNAQISSGSNNNIFRLDRTVDKIKQFDADFLCLQECLPHMYLDLCDKLSQEYVGFHMKDIKVSNIDELIKVPNDSCFGKNENENSKQTPSDHEKYIEEGKSKQLSGSSNDNDGEVVKLEKSDGDGLEKQTKRRKPKIVLGNAIFVRKRLICNSNDKDPELELLWARSGLFKDFAPILPSCAGSRITGKARKRLLACDSDGFIAMKFRTQKFMNTEGSPPPAELILFCAHLFYDPNFPHVKAMQAEILGHLAHTCATGKLIPNPYTNQKSKHQKKKKKETQNTIVKTKDSSIKSKKDKTSSVPCAVVIAGDLNTIPLFQPEFLQTEEEINNLLVAFCCNGNDTSQLDDCMDMKDKKEHDSQQKSVSGNIAKESNVLVLDKLPKKFQQSGAFRLITEGVLESNHPEHPDTFGRGKENNNNPKKMKRCGPLYMPFLAATATNQSCESKSSEHLDSSIHHYGFHLAYPYDHDHFTSNSPVFQRSRPIHENDRTNPISHNCFPDRTTRVSDFEGVLDHIFWRQYPPMMECQNKEINPPVIWQTGVLDVPDIPDPIPNKEHTSDHLPVGMSFELLQS